MEDSRGQRKEFMKRKQELKMVASNVMTPWPISEGQMTTKHAKTQTIYNQQIIYILQAEKVSFFGLLWHGRNLDHIPGYINQSQKQTLHSLITLQ